MTAGVIAWMKSTSMHNEEVKNTNGGPSFQNAKKKEWRHLLINFRKSKTNTVNRYRVVSRLVQCPNPHPGRGSHCLLEAAYRQPQKMQTNVRQARVQILLAIPPRDVKSSSSHRKEAPEGNAQGGRSAPVANTCSTAVHPESTPEWIDGQGVKRRWCTACKNHMAKAPVQA